jgi:hypothetical protein
MMASLLVRPTPVEGEWIQGYLGRLVGAHGVPIGRPSLLISAGLVPRSVNSPGDLVDTGSMSPWILSPKSMYKHCPRCLEEACPIPALWRLDVFNVCEVHRVCATHRCWACKGKITLLQMFNGECRCGVSLHAFAIEAQPARIALTSALNVSNPNTTDGLIQQAIAFKLLAAVARSMRGRDVRMTDLTVFEHAADWLAVTGIGFDASQPGLNGFLKDLRSPLHRAAAAQALDALREDELLQARGFDQHINQLQGALLLKGEVMQRGRALGAALFAKQMDGGISLFAGAKRLGVWPHCLRAALIELEIPTQSFVRAKTTFLVFSEEHMQRIEQHLKTKQVDRLPLGVSTLLQVDRGQMRSLKRSGLVTVRQEQSHDKNAALDLVEQLVAVARPIESAAERVIDLLHPSLWVGKQCIALKLIVMRIQAGRVSVYRDLAKSGLAQFAVPLFVLNEVSRLNKALHWKRLHRASAQSLLIELPTAEELLSC